MSCYGLEDGNSTNTIQLDDANNLPQKSPKMTEGGTKKRKKKRNIRLGPTRKKPSEKIPPFVISFSGWFFLILSIILSVFIIQGDKGVLK